METEKLDSIIEGALYGDINLIKNSLSNGVNPNFKYRGYSALQWAVQEGQIEAISLLIENGADIETRDDQYGCSILDTAVGECSNSDKSKLKLEVVKLLIEKGADINGKTDNGSVLHTACAYGLIEVVKLLLTYGIKTDLKDPESKLAIEYAKENGHNEIVKLIKTHHNNG